MAAFQYISCYSLSVLEDGSDLFINWFQYISCYSLSIENRSPKYNRLRFNTSHVTLYLVNQCFVVIPDIRFNTSHVTLYQVSA